MKKILLSNPLVFAIVMKDPVLCRQLLELIFPDRKVREVRFISSGADEYEGLEPSDDILEPQTEKRIIVKLSAKSIVMDVLFEDDTAWYNIELQVSNRSNPRKRSRYYQALRSIDGLKKGQSYDNLKPGYVIFICLFDLFKQNKPVYYFEMRDETGLCLEDGQYSIFMNAACTGEMPADLDAFYRFLRAGEVTEGNALVHRLDDAVEQVARNEKEVKRVTLYDDMVRMERINEALQAETEALQAETEALQVEKEALQAEAEALQVEKEALQIERETLQAELARVNRLNQRLAEENRIEDMLKAAVDSDCRNRLMAELEI